MAYEQNNLGNIISAVGHISGDCFVKNYDPNFDWTKIDPNTWEADLTAGTIDALGLVNVGFITTDGAPELQTPDTEDNTSTTDLWDGIPYKTGRTTITGRHIKFTLAETARDSAIKFVNGDAAISATTTGTNGSYRDVAQQGSNPTAQTIIIPAFRSDNILQLIIIERGMVVIDDVIKYTPNEPITYAIDVDPQTGAKLSSAVITREQVPAVAPVNPQKETIKKD